MIAVAMTGIFVTLCGIVLLKNASNHEQTLIGAVPLGVGLGLLVISAPWWIR